MTTVFFDTLKFANRLEQAGFSREQSSAIAEAHKDVFAEALHASCGKKSDIAQRDRRMSGLGAKLDSLTWMMGALTILYVATFAKQFF